MLAILLTTFFPLAHSQDKGAVWSVVVLDKVLASVPPGAKLARVGDMEILVSNLRAWRNALAGQSTPGLAFDGDVPIWTDGNLYYTFDASVSIEHQKVFLDGAKEWATFASLRFIPRTTEPNYFTVKENPFLAGGQSALGMVGGQQFLQFGPNAWNRGTICHELGHTLGLVHEHQRSDRDSFVTILTGNIVPGAEIEFVKLTNSRNQGPYDFLSITHYARNTLSVDPNLDTIQPLPAFNQFLNILGQGDPLLTPLDREGLAAIYGAGPAFTSVVTNTQDSGPGSLRTALYYGFDHPGTTITFNIPTSDSGFSNNVFNILPTDQLPSLWNATVIDGSTQPTNSNPNGPEILLSGALAPLPSVFPHGLLLRGTDCVVHSLIVGGFARYGILIDGTNATGNVVSGCYLGTDPSGTFAVTNGFNPIAIANGASGNRIGGSTISERNIISGSSFQGLVIRDPGTRNNLVQGNYIGLNAAGNAPLANTWSGVSIFGGARSNLIGGPLAGMRNFISGNANQGIVISDADTDGNRIEGNYIGLNPSGTAAIPNGWAGVEFFGGVKSNIVGGNNPGARNIISGNTLQGVLLSGSGTVGNLIQGNLIGVNATGSAALSNGWAGVELFGGVQNTLIGGAEPGAGNTVSGNGLQGIVISGDNTTTITIQGNLIGSDPSGTVAISNRFSGVDIFGGVKGTLIGGATVASRNIISGNGGAGVSISGFGSENTKVQGNFVGVDSSGLVALPNGFSGVSLFNGAKSNLIGGVIPGMRNIVSGNASSGVTLSESGTSQNRVEGNFIGLDAAGTAAISNAFSGVAIFGGAQANVIGGGVGARNFISGNGNSGIAVTDPGTDGNWIQGNTVGLDGANSAAIPNRFTGVVLFGGAQSNQIGGLTLGSGNIIASNLSGGVLLFDGVTTNNSIRGNSIFGNSVLGIDLFGGANRSLSPPTLTAAVLTTNLVIFGSLSLAASTTVHLDFYANPAPLGSAQGKTFIGTRDISSGSGGTTDFSFGLNSIVPAGRILTGTVTDSAGNTSPLSPGVTVVATSSVNDGIPDAWRAAFFGGNGTTTNSQSCAMCDPDGDGADNLGEFLAGTNPTNSPSRFVVASTITNGFGGTVSLQTVPGIIYRLEARDDLNTNLWSILVDQVVGNGSVISVADPAALVLPRRFYRGRIIP